MNKKEIKKMLDFTDELINIFIDYSIVLDNYFRFEGNRLMHKDLYDEYKVLSSNIKDLIKKNGYDVK